MRKRWLTAVMLLLGLGWGTAASSAADGQPRTPSELAPKYREWLLEVDLLLRKEERQAFLALREDYQRDGFIQKFWEARDPNPGTSANEFKGAWYARLDQARHDYGNISEDRARMLLLHGQATRVWKTDCQLALWPLEIWYYLREERLPGGFFAIFYQPAAGGPYRLWNPSEGEDALQALFRDTGEDQNDAVSRLPPNRRQKFSALADLGTTGFERTLERLCRGDDRIVIKAYLTVLQEAQLGNLVFTEYPPPPRDTEWLATFLGRSTDLPESASPSKAADRPAHPARPAPLAAKYRQWLEEVDLLLRKDEREAFLALKEDYQRDGFIQKFWESRDPYPETPENEFKQTWYARLDEAKRRYGNIKEDRARALLLHGEASRTWKTDCQLTLWPLEIWHYARTERLPADFYLLFYQPGGGGPFRLWTPTDGYDATQVIYRSEKTQSPRGDSILEFEQILERECSLQVVLTAFRAVRLESQLGTLPMVEYPPPPRDTEWLATFLGLSTDLAPGAPPLAARLTFGFPERRGNRTLIQGVLEIPRTAIAEARLEGHGVYSLLLTGEVLRDGALHESFRYRYDLPAPGAGEAAGTAGDTVPLVFERALRPGEYTLVIRLDDLTGKRSFRESRPLSVPQAAEARTDPAVAAALGAARQSLDRSDREAAVLHLVPPPGETATGGVRIEAKVSGEAIHKVSFALDGKPLLTKTAPPYSVLLALGALPTPHTVRAVGLDNEGQEVATDELVLNGAPQRFAVRLREPRRGARTARAGENLAVRAEVQVPDGQTLDRLEIFLDERRVATLYQPPFSQPLTLPSPLPRYVRALATLADGGTAEDLVLLSAPGYQENLDVPLVEVYAAVKDAQGRPVLDLKPADFRVLDGGAPQQLLRWEKVTDLPVSVALLIDTSASMVKSLPEAQRAALGFLRSTLSPRDRAALIPFSESPRLAVKLTHDLPNLAGALAGLQAERGTALWDSLVFGLHYLQGTQGQRALLLLTDGGDRSSHFSFDEALELARRSGVVLYTVGLAVGRLDLDVRHHLTRLAEETGGRSFFPDAASDLAGIYTRIQEELRSRYLLVYQPATPGRPGEYRPVAVEVDRPGTTVEALRGYYP